MLPPPNEILRIKRNCIVIYWTDFPFNARFTVLRMSWSLIQMTQITTYLFYIPVIFIDGMNIEYMD